MLPLIDHVNDLLVDLVEVRVETLFSGSLCLEVVELVPHPAEGLDGDIHRGLEPLAEIGLEVVLGEGEDAVFVEGEPLGEGLLGERIGHPAGTGLLLGSLLIRIDDAGDVHHKPRVAREGDGFVDVFHWLLSFPFRCLCLVQGLSLAAVRIIPQSWFC